MMLKTKITSYPNSPYRIYQRFSPSGDQPQAISKIIDGINDGLMFQTLLGVTGSGKTFTMAHVIAKLGRPAIVLVHNKTLAAQLYSEFRELFPENRVEYFVSYYDYYQPESYVPHKDLYIEKDSSINDHIEQMRLSTTKSLLERRDVIIVATVSAIYGIGDAKTYHKMILFLEEGEQLSSEKIIKQLVSMQYERADYEFKRGCFRVRGESIDIFPAEHYDVAIKIVLFDDVIESLHFFDPLTGKNQQRISKFTIFPSSHFVTPHNIVLKACNTIEKELHDRVKYYEENNKMVEAYRIKQRTEFDLEMLREIGFCKGIENYSRHLTLRKKGDPPPTLIDYLPDNSLMFIDESHATIPQIGAMYLGDKTRKENLVEYGFRLPSALDNRPLKFEEFEKRMPQTIFVSATPSDYEAKHQDKVIELIIRPTGLIDPVVEIRKATTQVDDLLGEIKKRIKANERVLVTTLTKKMAEKLAEYYGENNIKTRYLHADIDTVERVELIRDLRAGVFDVLVGVNLLREGLDMPEVSLVAILDADKEGFLRSARSLIQTIGRVARNIHALAILYADKETQAMRIAINETNRRRFLQIEYNKKNNITPITISKPIVDIIDGIYKEEKNKKFEIKIPKHLSEKDLAKLIKKTEEAMKESALNLDFEKAVKLRDELKELKKLLFMN